MAVHAKQGNHSEWFTPKQYVDAARNTMGTIDLDPASSESANHTVKAKYYFTSDGLDEKWFGNVFCNPPYSNFRGEAATWARRMNDAYLEDEIKQGIILLNQSIMYQITDVLSNAVICIVDHRIAYVDGHTMKPQKSPPQSNMFLYFGEYAEHFNLRFLKFGVIMKPYTFNNPN